VIVNAADNWHAGEKEMTMLPDAQLRTYTEFYDSARYNDILEPGTTLMLHLASAMALSCDP
jgi:hypothetical protein